MSCVCNCAPEDVVKELMINYSLSSLLNNRNNETNLLTKLKLELEETIGNI